MKIEVYADGSANSVGKPGGYGWAMTVDGILTEQGSGHMESASNNDAELAAATHGLIAALKFGFSASQTVLNPESTYPPNIEVTLVSDSRLVLGWASGEYQFKQLDKIDKFNNFHKLVKAMKAKTRWVKGHSGDPLNELCDKLANAARLKKSNEIEVEEKKAKGETLIGTRKTGIVCLYYKDVLKIVDLRNDIVETYNRDLHGTRGGILEVREEKNR